MKFLIRNLFRNKYRERCRNFYSSSISGLFTGITIGIFFSFITYSTFHRWINFFSYEIFVALIYLCFAFIIIAIFYFIGYLIMRFLILRNVSNKGKELIGFRINFLAGIYSAFFGTSLLILKDRFRLLLLVTFLFLILYFPLEYIAVVTKQSKRKG